MSAHAELSWLPPPPEDFAARCRALDNDDAIPAGQRIRALAGYALDENQLTRLARVIGRTAKLTPLVPFRLGILGNATTHHLVPGLVATAARHGFALECIEAEYGQVMQEALSPESKLVRGRPDAVLLALDYRGLPLRPTPGDPEQAQATISSCLGMLQTIRTGLRANGIGLCLVQTIARPPETLFGSLDLALPGTYRHVIDAINRGIADSLAGTPDLMLDVGGLADLVGLENWHDPTQWNVAKLPFASAFLPLYADHVGRLLAAIRGKSRRCLILDLDNTLWHGVIGDDGLEGIVIGQGDPTGEAHLSLQQTALMLRGRGIVLAVSSKNNDAVARLPFREHPEMLLRENHVAVFQANWNDKATNITAIAKELALGLDAMVFVDDNPAERGLVRQLLPDVAVPELPADPALYARTLLASGYFEAVTFSAEDRARADFYQDNAQRVALQQQAGDVDGYLASLDMTITFMPFDETNRARITQLINKSNQFNLTTRRYTEADVRAAEHDSDCFTLQVRLADTFGDNGMISVIICRRAAAAAWEVDTWLMSCRVLGRKVEQAVLAELVAAARGCGIDRLVGVYRPTSRNQLVEDHYAKLGFVRQPDGAEGATIWTLDVATADIPPAADAGATDGCRADGVMKRPAPQPPLPRSRSCRHPTAGAADPGGDGRRRRVRIAQIVCRERSGDLQAPPGPPGVEVMRPNCRSERKAAEGTGHSPIATTTAAIGRPNRAVRAPAGGIRVALMGASTAQGLKVPYPDTFAARLTRALTSACHRPVEFQNMGVPGAGLLDIYRRLDEALALHPDLVMVVMTPYEMKAPIDPGQLAGRDRPPVAAAVPAPVSPPAKSLVARISDIAFNSRILVVAQHFLFQDRATFTKLFMLHGEDADYLRVPYRAGWEQRLRDLDTLLGEMADRAKAHGTGMMLVLGPQRIQASLLDPSVRPDGVDPYEIGRRIGMIASRHGVLFQDALDGFATVADPDSMFYAVDGHMDAAGHAVFAGSVLSRLILDSPVFRDCGGARRWPATSVPKFVASCDGRRGRAGHWKQEASGRKLGSARDSGLQIQGTGVLPPKFVASCDGRRGRAGHWKQEASGRKLGSARDSGLQIQGTRA